MAGNIFTFNNDRKRKKKELAPSGLGGSNGIAPGGFGAPFGTGTADEFLDFAASRQGGGAIDQHIGRASSGLQGVLREGFNVGAENDRRFNEAASRLTGAVDNLAPTISDEDFNNLFAQEASRGVGEFEGNLDLVNESIGIRGVSGGVAASLAVDAHAQFQQSLASAKGNVRVAKIQADAADAMRNLNAEFSLGNFLSQDSDETRLSVLAAFSEGEAGLAGLEAQQQAMRDANKNASKARTATLIGSILGAGSAAI